MSPFVPLVLSGGAGTRLSPRLSPVVSGEALKAAGRDEPLKKHGLGTMNQHEQENS